MDGGKIALIFKTFCDENRIRILNSLRGGEMFACRCCPGKQAVL